MKVRYLELTGASGSMGGQTSARNRGGNYKRARVAPLNPSSDRQAEVRLIMSSLSARWRDTLTPAQRDAWIAYADSVPKTDALGQEVKLTGLNAYIAGNSIRIGQGLAALDAAPSGTGLAILTPPTTVTLTAQNNGADSEITVDITLTDSWAAAQNGILQISISPGFPESIHYFKSGFRVWGYILRGAGAPTDPVVLSTDAPFTVLPGKYYFFRLRSVDAQGRISSPYIARVLAELPV